MRDFAGIYRTELDRRGVDYQEAIKNAVISAEDPRDRIIFYGEFEHPIRYETQFRFEREDTSGEDLFLWFLACDALDNGSPHKEANLRKIFEPDTSTDNNPDGYTDSIAKSLNLDPQFLRRGIRMMRFLFAVQSCVSPETLTDTWSERMKQFFIMNSGTKSTVWGRKPLLRSVERNQPYGFYRMLYSLLPPAKEIAKLPPHEFPAFAERITPTFTPVERIILMAFANGQSAEAIANALNILYAMNFTVDLVKAYLQLLLLPMDALPKYTEEPTPPEVS